MTAKEYIVNLLNKSSIYRDLKDFKIDKYLIDYFTFIITQSTELSKEELSQLLHDLLEAICTNPKDSDLIVSEIFSLIKEHGSTHSDIIDNNHSISNLLIPLENPVSMSEVQWIHLLRELNGLEMTNKIEQVDLKNLNTSIMNQQKLSLELLASKRQTSSIIDKERLSKAEMRLKMKQERRARAEAFKNSHYSQNIIHSDNTILDESAILEPQPKSRSRDIKVERFDITLGGKHIITEGDLNLPFGRRIGLVGRNGVGKSTLLRAIESRQLSIPKHISILHVEQEVIGNDTSAITSVMQSDIVRETLLKRESICQHKISSLPDGSEKELAMEELSKIYTRLEEIESDKAESRASIILTGLGFSKQEQKSATKTFSGGWRMRLALARTLFCRPDLLLLDEPTNMLDIPAVAWLQSYLSQWPNTILVVSHDREFLDHICTDVLHLHHEKLDSYKGNYSQFIVTKEERRKHYEKEYESNLAYRQHLQEFIDKWRYNAARAALAQSKIKILEKLPILKPWPVDPPVILSFSDIDDKLSSPIIQLLDVGFSYNESALLLSNINLNIQLDSRIAIVGPNGAGKTTILKLILGTLSPTFGRVFINNRVRIALFSQHHVDQLDMNMNAIQFLAFKHPGKTEEEYRKHSGSFGLSGSLALQPIYTLSGGQKSRLVFATMSLLYPHILILDEPTNHLDVDSIDALMTSLKKFSGGIVTVSHDTRFIERVCNEIWVCNSGTMSRFKGTIREYVHSLTTGVFTQN